MDYNNSEPLVIDPNLTLEQCLKALRALLSSENQSETRISLHIENLAELMRHSVIDGSEKLQLFKDIFDILKEVQDNRIAVKGLLELLDVFGSHYEQ